MQVRNIISSCISAVVSGLWWVILKRTMQVIVVVVVVVALWVEEFAGDMLPTGWPAHSILLLFAGVGGYLYA